MKDSWLDGLELAANMILVDCNVAILIFPHWRIAEKYSIPRRMIRITERVKWCLLYYYAAPPPPPPIHPVLNGRPGFIAWHCCCHHCDNLLLMGGGGWSPTPFGEEEEDDHGGGNKRINKWINKNNNFYYCPTSHYLASIYYCYGLNPAVLCGPAKRRAIPNLTHRLLSLWFIIPLSAH